jgi:hypothetical protein
MAHDRLREAVVILEFALKVRERREGAETYEVREIQGLLSSAYFQLGKMSAAI